ncbi:MAG TPA: DUF4344 domain-containing metallopeptidase [Xanthobacteraceae bacterium]|nr:DUF4344 domain-containing metallopeptidase [Xanthobacteraceae bacterium]
MKCIVSAAALVFALVWTAMAPAPASAQITTTDRPGGGQQQSTTLMPSVLPPNPQVEIAYVEPRDARFRSIYDKLKKRQVLEQLRGFLSPLRLPRKLTVQVDQCGSPGAHYKPGAPVTICYEYIDALERAAPDVKLRIGGAVFTKDDAMVGAFVHVVLHETARAVFDILEIPVWGREEHAADRAAGFIMFQFGDKIAYRTLVGTSWFLAQSSVAIGGMPTGDFSYVRGLDGETLQRFYNTLCIAIGGDPGKFDFLKKTLPERRAQTCRWEYLQLARSFNDTFMPHVDRELLAKVRAVEWLKDEN